jgi:hypothetical protein
VLRRRPSRIATVLGLLLGVMLAATPAAPASAHTVCSGRACMYVSHSGTHVTYAHLSLFPAPCGACKIKYEYTGYWSYSSGHTMKVGPSYSTYDYCEYRFGCYHRFKPNYTYPTSNSWVVGKITDAATGYVYGTIIHRF